MNWMVVCSSVFLPVSLYDFMNSSPLSSIDRRETIREGRQVQGRPHMQACSAIKNNENLHCISNIGDQNSDSIPEVVQP